MTAHYSHLSPAYLRQAAHRLSGHLEQEPEEANGKTIEDD